MKREIRTAVFSAAGEELAEGLGLEDVTRFPGEEFLSDWTRKGFLEAHALIFIGACGIAVRAAAPYVRSKLSDPAVLVIDETGAFVIPLLSGHLGGANELARRIAKKLNAHAVITTATDRRHTFAADLWAVEQALGIVNPEAVKAVSAAVLDGEEIRLSVGRAPEEGERGTDREVLRLVPKRIVIGAGCRKGTDPAHFEECFMEFLSRHSVEPASVLCLASIDRKKDERALLELARKRRIPFLTFSAQQLMEFEGNFTGSDFVLAQTGVDNVCERAAVRAAVKMRSDGEHCGEDGQDGRSDGEHCGEDGQDGRSRGEHCGEDGQDGRSDGEHCGEDGQGRRSRGRSGQDKKFRDGSGQGARSGGGRPGHEPDDLFVRKEIFDGVTLAAARVHVTRSWEWV